MNQGNAQKFKYLPKLQIILAFLSLIFAFTSFAQEKIKENKQESIREIENVADGHIYVFGESIRVKGEAKEVLVLGGDVFIEGNIEGDVAAIGGTIYQKQDAFIGGDIIVLGGSYKHENPEPKRNADKQTIMYAGYEDLLKNTMQNPTTLLVPDFSLGFVGLRFLVCLFWFLISLVITTIAPGAVSRAVAGFQLSTLNICGIGALTIIVGMIVIFFALKIFEVLGVILLFMALLVFMLAIVFGRVVLQVSHGKWIQKKLLPEKWQSESLAILLGSLFWTILLSLPYLWTIAFFVLIISGFGLVITTRSSNSWKSS